MASPEVQRKTGVVSSPKTIPGVVVSSQTNPLNKFRSFNYVFTLAAVERSALADPALLRARESLYVIAKSGGKGTSGISHTNKFNTSSIRPGGRNAFAAVDPRRTDLTTARTDPDTAAGASFLDGFNTRSAGRFDFFIDNVEIDTVMAMDKDTSSSLATKIKFEVYEPYSINGFMQALQAAAVAAGHATYSAAPFLLKMEFLGYTDDDKSVTNNVVKLGKEGTRYFVMSFTNVEVDTTQDGTRYRCEAVPHNERAFGDPNRLKSTVKISGKTVQEILEDLMTQVTLAKQKESSNIRGKDRTAVHDRYEIKFPSLINNRLDFSIINKIAKAEVTDLLNTANNYKFADPSSATGKASENSKTGKTTPYNPTNSTVQFSENQNIHECIAAILRDSTYTKGLLKNINSPSSDAIDRTTGLVDYFTIFVESEPQGVWDGVTGRELYTYRFVVAPYKMHYTRIPMFEGNTVNAPAMKLLARRAYNYIYTGKNVDIQRFNLKFNNLYFQAIPQAMGNTPLFSAQNGVESRATDSLTLVERSRSQAITQDIPTAPKLVDTGPGMINAAGGTGGKRDPTDPYDILVKNMHQAVLDNLSMVQADVSILGDPFYLVTGGMGNYRPDLLTYGETVDGEAAFQTGDVYIVVNFRTPIDLDKKTGNLEFDTELVPFSGVFRVITVNSTFKGGLFEQQLNLVRVPGQPVDTNQAVTTAVTAINTAAKPSSDPIAVVEDAVTPVRASETQVAQAATASVSANSALGSDANQSASLAKGAAGINLTKQIESLYAVGSAVASSIASDLRKAAAGLPNVSGFLPGSSTQPILQVPSSTLVPTDQVTLGSAELLNSSFIPDQANTVAAKFGDKSAISPLARLTGNQ